MTAQVLHEPHVSWTLMEYPEDSGNIIGMLILDGGGEGETVSMFANQEYLRGVGASIEKLADALDDAQEQGGLPGGADFSIPLETADNPSVAALQGGKSDVSDEAAAFLREQD